MFKKKFISCGSAIDRKAAIFNVERVLKVIFQYRMINFLKRIKIVLHEVLLNSN
jgi:hypothetical protein